LTHTVHVTETVQHLQARLVNVTLTGMWIQISSTTWLLVAAVWQSLLHTYWHMLSHTTWTSELIFCRWSTTICGVRC